MRDDHDSTKKRGQIDNFLKKYNHVKTIYPINNIVGIMWFVDDSFKKNKGFYHNEISNLNKYDRNLHLFYGKELFDFFELPHIWDELIEHLENFWKTKWRLLIWYARLWVISKYSIITNKTTT
nr:hypothetical protein [Mycoplasmopsis bovis]